jgi:hypothetical protein
MEPAFFLVQIDMLLTGGAGSSIHFWLKQA